MKPTHVILAAAGAVVVLTTALGYWYGLGARAGSLAESSDPEVRMEAVALLRGSSSVRARDVLGRLSGDADPRVAREAVRALGAGNSAGNCQALVAILQGGGAAAVRGEAAAALGKYDGFGTQRLLEVLRDKAQPPAVRAGAARGLGQRRDRAALADLVRLLRDPAQEVRIAAITAINRINVTRFAFDAGGPETVRDKQAAAIERMLANPGRSHPND